MSLLDMKAEHSKILDEIIESRVSIRTFKPDIPPKELIRDIVHAGLRAPYAAQAVLGSTDFRRFAVINKESKILPILAEKIKENARKLHGQITAMAENNPEMQKNVETFLKRLGMVMQNGIPSVTNAPYYIIVAEQKGIPPVEQESLAHCLQNMWLKATSLGLGFQLISVTSQFGEDKELCDLLGFPYKKYSLNGCVIGYPLNIPSQTPRSTIDEVTAWF
jgi:nitroreductase